MNNWVCERICNFVHFTARKINVRETILSGRCTKVRLCEIGENKEYRLIMFLSMVFSSFCICSV